MKIFFILCLALTTGTTIFNSDENLLRETGKSLFSVLEHAPASAHSVVLSNASPSTLFGLFLFFNDEYFKAKDDEAYPYFFFDKEYNACVELRNILLQKVLVKLMPLMFNDSALPELNCKSFSRWLRTNPKDYPILESSVIEILSDTANWQENGAEEYLNVLLSFVPHAGVEVLTKLLKRLEPNTENIEKKFLEVFKVHSEMCITFDQFDVKMLEYFFSGFSFDEQVEMFQQGDQLMKFFLVEFWTFSGLEIEDSDSLQEVFYISESEFVIKYFICNYEITLESFELFYTHQTDESFKFLIQNVDDYFSEIVLDTANFLIEKQDSFPQRYLDFVRISTEMNNGSVDLKNFYNLLLEDTNDNQEKEETNKS